MDHNERVTKFLEARNLTMETVTKLPREQQTALDAEFRAERKADEAVIYGDVSAVKISRAEMKRRLPLGTPLTLIYAMGSPADKPRTVAAHRSYGFDFTVPDKKTTSRLSFEQGETVWVSGNILTVRDKDGEVNVRYRLVEKPTIDFSVQNEGTIFILRALSSNAKQWVADHLPEDVTTWGVDGVVVEHRYIADIVAGIQGDGLAVR